jgi:hypothetical protein
LFSESSDLEKLVKENPSSNYLIDEAPVSDKSFPTKTLAKMSSQISVNNYLWVACQSDKTPSTQDSNLEGNYLRFNSNIIKHTSFICLLNSTDFNKTYLALVNIKFVYPSILIIF